MRALLVGYGSIGRRHLNNFHDLGVDDWAIVHTGKGTLPLEPPCPVRTYADLGDALERESPTFAVVANPTSLHVDTALACIDAGCHLFLEKPVSHSTDRLDALASAASDAGVQVLVAYHFRYHPALARIRELVHEGSLGAPLHARAIWGEYLPSWHPWEDWRTSHAARRELGGGVLHISHPIDSLRMLFGDAVVVGASFRAQGPLGLDVAESADLLLRFASGVDAALHLDYWTRPTANRLEVSFAEGTVSWDYISGELRSWTTAHGEWESQWLPGVESRNDLFVAESRHFLDVVDGRATPACTLGDGIAVVRIAEAAEEMAGRAGAQDGSPRSGPGA